MVHSADHEQEKSSNLDPETPKYPNPKPELSTRKGAVTRVYRSVQVLADPRPHMSSLKLQQMNRTV